MLNKLWPVVLIASFLYGIIDGKIESVNQSIFDSTKNAVELSITFIGTIGLWNGIMQIVKNTTLIKRLTKLIRPIINFLFPEIKNNEKIKEQVSINIIANILGLGNAATPAGLKAIKTMQEENKNKDELSNSMKMFLIINTASLQIIPTTAIAIRASLKSKNPTLIILPVWGATIVAFTVAVLLTKLLIYFKRKKGEKNGNN